MNCEKFREIIITDYIDGELSPEQTKITDEHLITCPDCRKFKEELIKNAVYPFRMIEKIAPPEYVRQNITNIIAERSSVKNRGLTDFLRRYAYFPGIPVAATAAIILIIGSFLFSGQPW